MADVLHMIHHRPPGDAGPRPALLIVDDDATWRKLLRDLIEDKLGHDGVTVLDCESISSALEILTRQPVHAMILDKNLGEDSTNPDHNGILAIPKLRSVQDHLQIVMATSSEDPMDVQQAILYGACTYIVKRMRHEYIEAAIKRALATGLELYLARMGLETSEASEGALDIPGKSPATIQLRLRVHEAAKTEAPVTLLGETGTGKSTVAKLIHQLRTQYLGKKPSERPFVHINMGAITESLAESELFGHEAGAFTDAKKRRFGALERARGGTLFLDEIAEAPLTLQVKLLTALDEKKFVRVGGEEEVRSQFRLICATNRNLEQLVREGKFREDLYRRITILEIKVPSVRERALDVPEIVRAVLPKCSETARVRVSFDDIPEDFLARLADNPPIGNIGGIEAQITRLLAHAPRDRRDRPILKQWRNIRELKINMGEIITLPNCPITMSEFTSRPWDVVGRPGFSGFGKFLRLIERKLYEDGRRKFGSDHGSNRRLAAALAVTEGVVSRKLTALGMARSERKGMAKKGGDASEPTIKLQ